MQGKGGSQNLSNGEHCEIKNKSSHFDADDIKDIKIIGYGIITEEDYGKIIKIEALEIFFNDINSSKDVCYFVYLL